MGTDIEARLRRLEDLQAIPLLDMVEQRYHKRLREHLAEAAVGRVGRRGGDGGSSAAATRARRRASTSRRLSSRRRSVPARSRRGREDNRRVRRVASGSGSPARASGRIVS